MELDLAVCWWIDFYIEDGVHVLVNQNDIDPKFISYFCTGEYDRWYIPENIEDLYLD